MKKVIFLVLILNSFLFSFTGTYKANQENLTFQDYSCPSQNFYNAYKTTSWSTSSASTVDEYLIPEQISSNALISSAQQRTLIEFVSCSAPISGVYTHYFKRFIEFEVTYTCSNTCPSGQIKNEETCLCTIPPPDADGDGTPDKCDFDYIYFSDEDCEGDGIPNGSDPDIDGDGIPNEKDSNSNGYGDPIPFPDSSCLGADKNSGTMSFPFSEYTFYALMSHDRCENLLYDSIGTKIDDTATFFDINPKCVKDYCYVHYKKTECNYDVAFYRPGLDWDYHSGLTENACSLLVDDIKYIDKRYAHPATCPEVGLCFVKRKAAPLDTNSTNPNIPPNPDTNSTTADLAPLLESQNIANDLLKGLGEKADTTNKNLDDLKKIANDSLNTQQDSKSLLSDLKKNSDNSLINQNSSLEKLSSLSKSLGEFSDVSTKNQMIGNEHLSSIDGKMNTNNALLTSIDNSLKGDGTSPDTSALDGAESALTDFDSFVDSVTSQFSTFKDNIQGNLDDVMNQYNNAKSLLTSGQAPTMSGGGSLECASFNVFGKHVVLDLSFLSVLSPVFYYIFTAYFMLLNFSFLIRHLFGSGN